VTAAGDVMGGAARSIYAGHDISCPYERKERSPKNPTLTQQGWGTRSGRAKSALFGFAGLGEHGGLFQGFPGLLESFGGMLHGALGLFVSGEVVLFAVSR
jgi:hypothetical protein